MLANSLLRPLINLVLRSAAYLMALTSSPVFAVQSALTPASPHAEDIATLWWVMLGGAVVIFVAVMLTLGLGQWRARRSHTGSLSAKASRNLVVVAGIVIPLITVIALVGGSLALGNSITSAPPEDAIQIRVTGWMWWWEVEYLDSDGRVVAVTANEIHIPVGQPVHIQLESADVIHSFWVPELQGKTDMVPGVVNNSWFTATEAGVFRGQCAEFCGQQHALMAFLVIAEPPGEYAQWLAHQKASAAVPETPQQRLGQKVFMDAGCQFCHRIRGTAADGDSAPDLTHLATRRTLAAVTAPNNRGHLTGWVADPEGIKPGVFMPAFELPSEDFVNLIAYLESLR